MAIQESFYNLPRLATVERWRRAAPPPFEFVLKAPQLITHEPTSPTYRRLRIELSERQKRHYGAFKPTAEVYRAWADTLTLAPQLRSKVVLFQCPASFTPTPQHTANLAAFFEEGGAGGPRRGLGAPGRVGGYRGPRCGHCQI
ncbi:MAG: DUF72 domain-containing protein [Candidatus Rokubacteria bacterium]|nr:DUF72 domain-containing protein [Candidatus Rokubacteria bacterium]